MKEDKGFEQLGNLFNQGGQTKKPPAYSWQDLALRIIKDLKIPNFKRNAVFRVCKINSRQVVEKAVTDTKELCNSREKWKYFFKVIGSK